jgi:GNAT superfamily N-acetyltransferase
MNRQPEPEVRAASQGEAAAISSLAIRSKAHWGYSDEFLQACREELSYSDAQIASADYEFWVCEFEGDIVGFYAIDLFDSNEAELEALFVEPTMIGRGFGCALIEHAKDRVAALGIRQITIQGDPNAEAFYAAAGGVRDGERESESIPGRFLPIFKITL